MATNITFRTVIPGPPGVTRASLRIDIESSVTGAVRETLERILIHGRTIQALPPLLADTGAFDAEAMGGAGRMRAVNISAELPFISSDARAFSVDAVAVAVAVGHFTFVVAE